jgi:RNA polymerase sigma-70 factor (ECF subfamily)
VLLADQDRSRWHRAEIDEGVRLLDRAMLLGRPGPYQLQAAIAALHAQAPSAPDTDWQEISALYARLLELAPTPVVALNHAVAVAEAGRIHEGLELIDEIDGLERYRLLHAARAELLRRVGRLGEAAAAYERALGVAGNPAEQAFLRSRLAEIRN